MDMKKHNSKPNLTSHRHPNAAAQLFCNFRPIVCTNCHMFNKKIIGISFPGVNSTNFAISWNFLLIPQKSKNKITMVCGNY